MLILTRRGGETIRIGDQVKLIIKGVTGNQVSVGIEAPRSVAVHREEIYVRIQREQREKEQETVPPEPAPVTDGDE